MPSRRLGQSLGVNNVTSKVCSYACVYCQVGPTTEKIIEPRHFFTADQIYEAVAARVQKLRARGLVIDYVTLVPDGEPTLDCALGDSIDAMRDFDIPIAVITNGTLLWRKEVRARLLRADLVSVKVDTVLENAWHQINRPHPDLRLDTVLQGIRQFAASFDGTLITDTMLIAGTNDDAESLTETANFLTGVAPDTAYLAVPTRPTTVRGVHGTNETGLTRAHEIFSARLPSVELLTGHEVGEFAYTGDARGDLLAVTAVHPMREEDVRHLLIKDRADWSLVEDLLAEGAIKSTAYEGDRYFLRPVRCGRG